MALLMLYLDDAQAQIETLVMPGEVITGHEEIEAECGLCHEAFDRSKQRDLCLDCHEEVASDITGAHGFHGLDHSAARDSCAACHTDHEGRDADIVNLVESLFDHELTDFHVLGKHLEAQCSDCHEPGVKHRDAPSDCFACHEPDNPHGATMGNECGDCHSATGWLDASFDHDITGFALVGKHADADCGSCHADQTFLDAPTTCYGCHAADDAHDGRSGQQCGDCHSPSGWADTSFDHSRDTQFALLGRHSELSCSDCHGDDPFADSLETGCVSCHRADDSHDGHFGEACATCHASDAWDKVPFNHALDTGHKLNGAHESLECESCHLEPIFEVALEKTCLSCHESDDVHKGTQGTQCLDCHDEHSWDESVFFDHDLTRFPLLGAHADEACLSCHQSQVFRDTSTACVDCHHDDDPHENRFNDNCSLCHNPVSWSQWLFDHDRQTRFILDGAHRDVSCETCHRRPMSQHSRLGSRCADCHRSDDVHDGEFGFDCGRCHSSGSFRDVRSIQ